MTLWGTAKYVWQPLVKEEILWSNLVIKWGPATSILEKEYTANKDNTHGSTHGNEENHWTETK